MTDSPSQDGQSAATAPKNRPTPKQPKSRGTNQPKGTMQRLAQMRVVIIGIVIFGMVVTGFAALPMLFERPDTPAPSASAAPSDNTSTPLPTPTLPPTPVGEDEVVFTLNGKAMTRKAIEDEMRTMLTPDTFAMLADPSTGDTRMRTFFTSSLSGLITEQMIEPKREEYKITVSDEDIQKAYDEYIKNFFDGDKTKLEQGLKDIGITDAGMRRQISLPIVMERIIDQEQPVTPEELEEATKELYKQSYPSDKIVSHIQLANMADAEKALKRVTQGKEDFAKVAQEVSLDEGTKAQGGLLGPFEPNVFPETFENAVKGSKPGSFAGPITTEYGVHILKVDPAPSYEEAKVGLVERARQKVLSEHWEPIAESIDKASKLTIDPRFGTWQGIIKGGIVPVMPQPAGLHVDPVAQSEAPSADGSPAPKPTE